MNRLSYLFASIITLLLGVAASAQTVVVNKYFNSGSTAGAGDVVELLVTQNGLDMRGMILKDFSSNMASDGGGKYQFSNDALWASVPAGTLIVLRNDTSAADTAVGTGDYNLDLGLKNTTYFAAVGTGTFDIATTEMVMIKAAGSGDAGVAGNIHTLAGGTAGTQFNNITTGAKLRATGTSGANFFIYANNTTETLADFNGTDATGGATGLTFGAGNNAHNTNFINSLRTPPPAGEPTVQASNVTFTNVTATTLTVNWTNGNGTRRLVLAKASAPVDAAPADGTDYAASAAFGSGAQIGAGNFVVFSGTGNSVTVTGLVSSTTYFFAVFEYNGTGAAADYLTNAPATGSQTTAAAYSVSGHIQKASGVAMAGVTVTLAGGTTPQTTTTDANGDYAFTNVAAGGNYTVTARASGFTFTPTSQTFNNLSANQVAHFTGTSQVIISEFRFHGTDPDGAGAQTAAANEFVELYNQSDVTVDISGWTVVTSDNDTTAKYVAPVGAIISARGHFLVAGASYSLPTAADGTLSADIPDGAGLALFNNNGSFSAGTQLDAVGFSAVANPLFRTGTGLAPAGGVTTDGEYSFARKLASGVPQVTGDNAADFVFVATNGGTYDGAQATLGAPSPENRISPIQRNGQIKAALIDPQAASTAAPNRVRDTTPNVCGGPNCPLGTLTIRRAFKNSTGAPLTSLRFRIVDITTLGSAGAGPTQADLRALSSADVSVTLTNGTMVPVSGLTLEEPPAQPLGGGLHSALVAGAITTSSPIAPNASINVQFVLGVQQGGSFRFLVNVEAPAPVPPASTSEHLTMGNPSGAITDPNVPFNYLLDKPQYAVSYHRDRGIPNWVSWHLDPTWLGSATRQNDFRADPTLPSDWYHVLETDYQGSGFDRGHHTPSADRTNTVADNSATFLMTNMMPQAPDNNQGPWEVLESFSRTLVSQGNELYIVAGGVGQGGTGSNGGVTQTIANGHVTVPAYTWKVIIVLPQGTDDVSRVTTQTRTIAVIMPNTQGIRTNTWQQYIVSVDQVEQLTGYDFFSNVPADIQAVIESRVDSGQAPATLGAQKATTTKLQ